MYYPNLEDIKNAARRLSHIINETPLTYNFNVSKEHQADVWLKREDLQTVRSYKIRGAYNKMSQLTTKELERGIVCVSAGNHAQGVAYSCQYLKVKGTIFMPNTTPKQKIEQVKMFGCEYVSIILKGDSFDDAKEEALSFCNQNNAVFIHPFDDEKIIEGQGTIALEILNQKKDKIDYLFLPVGGGGIAAGVSAVFKKLSPNTQIIGVEPQGAASMTISIQNNKNTTLQFIDKFVDGAAVSRVGDLNFNICKNTLDDIITVPEGKVCETILKLYNKDAIVVEPAGALTLAALDFYANKIKGKNVVCVVSGSNNDITRTEEIKERALLYAGLKHYFIVRFPQRAGALKQFVVEVLSPTDDITHFEYTKKNSRSTGQAIVGIELSNANDLERLVTKMKALNFFEQYLNEMPHLLSVLV
ncbi:MAG: threonine ammonia-lyase IlvA [Chitinophagales bacterium]|nr:threonine ammonia-lyase IlvA [Bacteroidota bacterium]MCB9043358.1 threonine ammonia-lyase IlvA [Chitinophagales bacterium]